MYSIITRQLIAVKKVDLVFKLIFLFFSGIHPIVSPTKETGIAASVKI